MIRKNYFQSKEEDEIRMSERASSQSLVDHLKSQLAEAVDQNETFQIQLQVRKISPFFVVKCKITYVKISCFSRNRLVQMTVCQINSTKREKMSFECSSKSLKPSKCVFLQRPILTENVYLIQIFDTGIFQKAANKRKELVEEMAKHLEKLKDVYSLEKANFQKNFDETTSALKKEVETLTSEVEV